jgi:hypothetical protein
MAELQTAPELVNSATADDSTPAVPAPVDGQPAETPAEATPPESFHVGDSDYTMDELVTHLETSKNTSAMHTAAHEKYTAANEALEKALAIQNDEELQELKTILTAIKRDGGMSQEWEAMRHGGGPMAMEVRLEQMESKLGNLVDENAGMKADDVLGQFAQKHKLTEEQAEAIGAEFLKETKAEHFPDGTTVIDQLDYFHWKNYEQSGQADALTAATKAGYDDAIGRVKAGQAAELGAPATQAEVPWEPPADADERSMLASELAALADDSIIFGEDDGDVLT